MTAVSGGAAPRLPPAPAGPALRIRLTIALKIFGIAVGLLVLMAGVALLSMQMTRKVDGQLEILDQNYFPAYVALAQANIHSEEESAYLRRALLAMSRGPDGAAESDSLRRQAAEAAKASDKELVVARERINAQIAHPLDFNDNVALARLDTRLEFLQGERRQYEAIVTRLYESATKGDRAKTTGLLARLDARRDDFDHKIDAVRIDMRHLATAAIQGTRAYQLHVVEVGIALVAIAGLLGLTVAAAVTSGLVRPVRRLLAGTAAVERGALDTVIPVTSRDEIGRLTAAFNVMVGELRMKEQIRETFGKYVDPRIVAGLLDRPEVSEAKGERRQMTILFCDMVGFTALSEGMTPTGTVTVLNRYLTLMSEAVRQNRGIIDKYIGDAVMAFWGPPFCEAGEQARLACFAALDQLAGLAELRRELPELIGIRSGLPSVDMRIGIATGDVLIGSIGSEQTRAYTVIGDAVNLASRLDGASKTYGTQILIGEATRTLAGDAAEAREIDLALVVGKSEPERIFELLGRKGQVDPRRIELRDAFAEALAAYRRQAWDEAEAGFKACLDIFPDDPPSRLFLDRIARFRSEPPSPGWGGVWLLTEK